MLPNPLVHVFHGLPFRGTFREQNLMNVCAGESAYTANHDVTVFFVPR